MMKEDEEEGSSRLPFEKRIDGSSSPSGGMPMLLSRYLHQQRALSTSSSDSTQPFLLDPCASILSSSSSISTHPVSSVSASFVRNQFSPLSLVTALSIRSEDSPRPSRYHPIIQVALRGALIGCLVATGLVLLINMISLTTYELFHTPQSSSTCMACPSNSATIDLSPRQSPGANAKETSERKSIFSRLFHSGNEESLLGQIFIRKLGDSERSVPKVYPSRPSKSQGSKLVIAGKMSLVGETGGGDCNIAQMDLETRDWMTDDLVQLNLYNSYSGGQIYSLMLNHTKLSSFTTVDNGMSHAESHDLGGDELIVVGAFDTTYRNSQVTYCSVGKWDGTALSKVGEGLCNSALSKGMKITAAALAGPQDVYVGGSFVTQVWQGESHSFVKIFNVAHYNALNQVWLPLPIGQITCSWCTVTIMALAWDPMRSQLHIAGKFNSIDGRNIPAGLAIYDAKYGRLLAHPGGGLSMINITEDGVGTSLQLDEENGVLYVQGSFERLTATTDICFGIAAYNIADRQWTCIADPDYMVLPSGAGNMLLTPYGLMISGLTTNSTTWKDPTRPYTINLFKSIFKRKKSPPPTNNKITYTKRFPEIKNTNDDDDDDSLDDDDFLLRRRRFDWSWLPGFNGHSEPIHVLTNGFDDYNGTVFIGGDNLIAKWSYQKKTVLTNSNKSTNNKASNTKVSNNKASNNKAGEIKPPIPKETIVYDPVTEYLAKGIIKGSVMAASQLKPRDREPHIVPPVPMIGKYIVIYCIAMGALMGMLLAIICKKNINQSLISLLSGDSRMSGISLDTLTYSNVENANVAEAYYRAMQTRMIHDPNKLTLINPQEILLHRIIGEGTFGRVWSANWGSSTVAVKEFVFAQAAVAGKSCMQRQIIEEIIGEAGMMAILRHPNVLQLFGCSLTAQAIWIVSELCSLGSLRQLLDDVERDLPLWLRLNIAIQVAEGMCYLHTQDPPIIHRDLKSHNIFVHEAVMEEITRRKSVSISKDNSGTSNEGKYGSMDNGNSHDPPAVAYTKAPTIQAKIGDWGSARAALSGSRTMTHGVGTSCWLAPEVIKYARSSKYSDVYSFGIVLWELATREEVYQGLETTQIIARVANDNLRPPIPTSCPWKDLMVQCWDENPQDRLTFNTIVQKLNEITSRILNTEGSDGDDL